MSDILARLGFFFILGVLLSLLLGPLLWIVWDAMQSAVQL
jgi:hypothetical protein